VSVKHKGPLDREDDFNGGPVNSRWVPPEAADLIEHWKTKYTASQEALAELLIEHRKLIEALEELAVLGNQPHFGNSLGNVIAQRALEKKP
jgi:hypothetical protein